MSQEPFPLFIFPQREPEEWLSKESAVFRPVQVDATTARHWLAASSLAPPPATVRAIGPGPLAFPSAQGPDERVDDQGGNDDSDAVILADEATQQRGEANHQAHVDPRQADRERTIHQRAIDEHINVPQPGAQHGEAK